MTECEVVLCFLVHITVKETSTKMDVYENMHFKKKMRIVKELNYIYKIMNFEPVIFSRIKFIMLVCVCAVEFMVSILLVCH